MARIDVKIYGIKETLAALDGLEKTFIPKIVAAMQKCVLKVEADAKKMCPVRTGRLRASISSAIAAITRDVIQGQVGAAVHYAIYVELGTSKMAPRPYLYPALEKNFDFIIDTLKEALKT